MPRRPRIHLADHPQHIVQRGHNQGLAATAAERLTAYRALFRAHLDEPALTEKRDAVNPQPARCVQSVSGSR